MKRLSISQFSTRHWDLEQDAIQYTAAGIQSIGIWRDKLSDYPIDFVCTLLRDLRLSVSSLSWAGGFTGSDGRSFDDAVEDGLDAIREAAQLGASCLIVHPGAQGLHTDRHSMRLLKLALNRMVPFALDTGVRLALMPMRKPLGSQWTFVSSLASALDICRPYNPDALGIVFNMFQFGTQIDEVDLASSELLERLALVQISQLSPRGLDCAGQDLKSHSVESVGVNGDAGVKGDGVDLLPMERSLLGPGAIPIEWWMSRFLKAGYKGHFEAELFSKSLENVAYDRRLELTLKFFRNSAAHTFARS